MDKLNKYWRSSLYCSHSQLSFFFFCSFVSYFPLNYLPFNLTIPLQWKLTISKLSIRGGLKHFPTYKFNNVPLSFICWYLNSLRSVLTRRKTKKKNYTVVDISWKANVYNIICQFQNIALGKKKMSIHLPFAFSN